MIFQRFTDQNDFLKGTAIDRLAEFLKYRYIDKSFVETHRHVFFFLKSTAIGLFCFLTVNRSNSFFFEIHRSVRCFINWQIFMSFSSDWSNYNIFYLTDWFDFCDVSTLIDRFDFLKNWQIDLIFRRSID